MGKTNGQGIEALMVRRASVADADKVRYRVYRTRDDFIAVIAESALMAVKVSGVDAPYRIVRDLPTEGVSIQAERLHTREEKPSVMLPLHPEHAAELHLPQTPTGKPDFVPLHLRDLENKKRRHVRILSAEELAAMMAASAPPPAPEPEPIAVEAVPLAPEPPAPEPEPEPPGLAEGELSPEEVEALLKK